MSRELDKIIHRAAGSLCTDRPGCVPVAPLRYRGKHRKRHSGHFPAADETAKTAQFHPAASVRGEKSQEPGLAPFVTGDPRIAADMRRSSMGDAIPSILNRLGKTTASGTVASSRPSLSAMTNASGYHRYRTVWRRPQYRGLQPTLPAALRKYRNSPFPLDPHYLFPIRR